ncbi:MAG: hypothetical protein V5A43_02205 [Haloarculaceae archaeon]
MDDDSSRRRFLALAGTGTAFSLAGCNGLGGGSEETTTDPQVGSDTTAEPDATTVEDAEPPAQTDGAAMAVGVAVSADQEELRKQQQQLQAELQSGNLSQQEAAERYQAIQQELRSQAIASLEDHVESDAGLTTADSLDQFGILLVSGTPANLLGTLEFDEVQAIVSETRFEQAKVQAEQRQTDTG